MSEERQEWTGLVERVRDGDRSAEEALVAVFQPRVHCMILARTRNLETARELTQEVILHLLHALRGGQIRQAESLPAFIHGIARNLVAGHRRSAGRSGAEPLPNGDYPGLVIEQSHPDERLALVKEALGGISRSDREILLMILVDGLSPGAIAARLKLNAEVVRQRKSRAIKRVRDHVMERLSMRRPER
jgi:RNA polymerase sigma-70 factor (ECF subfamily)